MTEKTSKNPLDVTGEQLRANVKRIREARGLSYQKLADRLAEVNRPIPTLGLSRIEKGERRVDADDLVALALVLRVNVSALLLPPTARGTGKIAGIDHPVSAFRLWSWAAGELALAPEDDPTVDDEERARLKEDDFGAWSDYWDKRHREWDEECRPHHRIDRTRDWARHAEALSKASSVAQEAVNGGMSIPAVLDFMQEFLQQPAMFERVDGKERVLCTVGDLEYNRMVVSDNWRQLSDEETRAHLAKLRTRASKTGE
ncbi:helix-turn-helix domain-containing protein [Streptosporangium sp. NBC_01810]|uniref:helix-turn-helix domain-containing protein n=1 Tax=Streptosporangium sp. NBC_01810 TaxID=2975951 RepID=UPI002DDB18D2|nr:helix-turn-helix transcriptional regulator [Streptosporangium sp. NBC_01810]WSA29421.1 helix-turn-helix domain-containing protein [Streptosporangium sp. NBC_01810]